jgi:hypothetical protein
LGLSDSLKSKLDLNLIDLCRNPKECSAFCYRYSKEDIEKHFREELNNSDIKYKKYPELSAYEWVLDKTLLEAQKRLGLWGRFIVFLINLLENTLKFTEKEQKLLMENNK